MSNVDPNSNMDGDILIVDDTTANLKLLADILSRVGYRVRPASDGKSAIRSAQSKLPTLVLIDINMPDMDGYEVCRCLKADEKTRSIPIILISALDEEREMVEGFQAGAVDYITKPFHAEEVLVRVDTHLKLRRLQLDLEAKNAKLISEIKERQRLDAEIRIEKDKVEQYLNIVGVMLVALDLEGKVTLINKRGCEILGYDKDKILGISMFDNFLSKVGLDNIKADFRTFINGDDPSLEFYLPIPVLCNGGFEKLIAFHNSVLRNERGEIIGTLSSGVEVTERIRAEEALQESERRFRVLSENALAGIYIIQDGHLTYVNKTLAEIFGYFPDELIGADPLIVIHPDDHALVTENLRRRIAGESSTLQYAIRGRCKNGEIKYIEVLGTRVNLNDRPAIIGNIVDITDRKQAEEALRLQSEIAANISEGIALIRVRDNVIVHTNDKFDRLFGYDPGELIGRNVSTLNATTDEINSEEMADEIVASIHRDGNWKGEIRNIKKDGTLFWCYTSSSQFDHPEYGKVLLSVQLDITERKLAEDALRESEEQYRTLVESQGEGIAFVDPQERFTFANPAAEIIFGVPPGDLIGQNVARFVTQDQLTAIQAQTNHRRAGSRSSYEIEIARPDGEIRNVLVTATPRFDNSGQFLGTIGIFRDITERKQAEVALLESEERFRSLVQTAADAIINIDNEGNVELWNLAAERIFGYSAREISGKPLGLIMPERFREAHQQGVQRVASMGESRVIGSTVEMAGLRKGGEEFPMELSLATWKTAKGVFFTGIAHDITVRKRAEEALRNLSLTDDLTRLYNRRGFTILAEQQIKLAHRMKRDMLLIFADLDGLKTINDTLGHAQGDLALIETATVLKETFREADLLARLGGDEFVVLAMGASKDNIDTLLNRLQENLMTHNRRAGRLYQLSLSMGIARYDPETPCSLGELIVQADSLMYQQKQAKHVQRL